MESLFWYRIWYPGGESVVNVRFRLNRKSNSYFTEKDLTKLKQDLKDLGKLRIIKQGKKFLEEWKRKKKFMTWLKMDVILS